MQTDCISEQLDFEGFDGRRVVAAFDGGEITSEAGALRLRHTDEAIGLFDSVAACFVERRHPALTVHLLRTMPASCRRSVKPGRTFASSCAAIPALPVKS